MSNATFISTVRATDKETDGQIFIHAFDFMFDVGTWTATRIAGGNLVMRKTAAANTSNPSVNLGAYFFKKIGADPQLVASPVGPTNDSAGNARLRGFQIKKIQVVYSIGTLALTAHSYDLYQTTYANNAAVSIDATVGGTLTGTLATATQTNPYVTAITIGTPYVIGANTDLVGDFFELTVNAQATSAYDLYGAFVDFNYVLL